MVDATHMQQHLRATHHDQNKNQIVDLRVWVALNRAHDLREKHDSSQHHEGDRDTNVKVIELEFFHGLVFCQKIKWVHAKLVL